MMQKKIQKMENCNFFIIFFYHLLMIKKMKKTLGKLQFSIFGTFLHHSEQK